MGTKQKENLDSILKKIEDSNIIMSRNIGKILDVLSFVGDSFRVNTLYSIYLEEKSTGHGYSMFRECNFFGEEKIRPLVERISFIMKEQDYPVTKYQVRDFLELFECNQEETDLILSACATDRQYQGWYDEEIRRESY